ncbi:MAG: hypothetical protein EXQ58_02570 [Acidobacteria bacterium]|nr:hypothetical protein [Acidobacteriota bacterium]
MKKRPRAASQMSNLQWHASGVPIAVKLFAGGVAWDRRPTLSHRLIAGKPPALPVVQTNTLEMYK